MLDSESEYDLRTPNRKKAFRDAINAAAYYSDRLSTRSARGKKLKAIGGEPNGRPRPFGFEADLVTVREDEAAILRDLTARFLAGETQDALIAELNARGITTSYGKPWTRAGLRKLLTRRETAAGSSTPTQERDHLGRRTPAWPANCFRGGLRRGDRHVYTRRRGRPNSWHYLCAGIARCGVEGCGRPLHGRPRNNVKPYPDGEVNRQYWCPKTHGGCGRIAVDQRALDEAATALAIEILADPRHTDAIEATAREIESEAARLDLAIAEAESVAEALAERLGRGDITLSRYDIAIRPLDERIAKLKAERAVLGGPSPQRTPRASREHWQRRWAAADQKEKRELLRMALRGRRLIVAPAGRGSPAERADVTRRITIE